MSVIKQEIEIEVGYYDNAKYEAVAFRIPREGERYVDPFGHLSTTLTADMTQPRLILRTRELEPGESYYGKMVDVRESVTSPWVIRKLLFVLPPGFDYRFLCECSIEPLGTKQWRFARVRENSSP